MAMIAPADLLTALPALHVERQRAVKEEIQRSVRDSASRRCLELASESEHRQVVDGTDFFGTRLTHPTRLFRENNEHC